MKKIKEYGWWVFILTPFLMGLLSYLYTFHITKITKEPICDNYNEIQEFKEPIPVIWTARLTGCLVSCQGAHFTRMPEESEYKYPRFSGYYPDASGKYGWDIGSNGGWGGSRIPDKFLEEDVLLKVYGKWTNIGADHPNTVFGGKCVPFVEIEKIEIVK